MNLPFSLLYQQCCVWKKKSDKYFRCWPNARLLKRLERKLVVKKVLKSTENGKFTFCLWCIIFNCSFILPSSSVPRENEWFYVKSDDDQVNNKIISKNESMFLNSKTIIPFQIFVSKKWGFTKFERDEFEDLRASGRVRTDGSHCKYLPEHGPLAAWCKIQAELAGI